MNTLKITLIVTLALASFACGGIEVGLDEKTIALAECLKNNNCSNNDSSSSDDNDSDVSDDSADDASDDNDSDSSDGNDTTASDDNDSGAVDPTDISGGIAVESYERIGDAYFLGTFSNNSPIGFSGLCNYDLPDVIRGYSHDDVIDFETSSGKLAFTARTYVDETFDFDARFQNSLGQFTISVTCTCHIEAGYRDYSSDEIQCNCDTDSPDYADSCAKTWEKI